MYGTPLDYERDYPENETVDVLWSSMSRSPSPEMLEWLAAEGVDPSRIVKRGFAVERMPDGTTRIVFQELLDMPEHRNLHICPDCGDTHLAKSGPQVRTVRTVPPSLDR